MQPFGLSHIDLPVQDLKRAQRFYAEGVGFEVRESRPRVTTLDGRGVLIRLVEQGAVPAPVELRLQTVRVGEAAEFLRNQGATVIRHPANQLDHTRQALLVDQDGHRLFLWRRLREDEYEQVPELPTTIPWDEAARALLQQYLQQTPVLFRDLARQGCTREAEFLAKDNGRVERRTVARALIRATPRMLRFRVRGPLRETGFDPEEFSEDFSI